MQGSPISPFMDILFDNGGKHIEADIRSIVAYVPSSHIYEGISFTGQKKKSSWTYNTLPSV
jgi:hypothetical protein